MNRKEERRKRYRIHMKTRDTNHLKALDGVILLLNKRLLDGKNTEVKRLKRRIEIILEPSLA